MDLVGAAHAKLFALLPWCVYVSVCLRTHTHALFIRRLLVNCVCVRVYARKLRYLQRPEVSEPLELERLTAGGFPGYVLGTGLGFSTRAGHTVDH